MPYKLGKTPPSRSVSFMFKDYFDIKKLPTPPSVFGHYPQVKNFFMLANDEYGDCVWAGAAHEHMVWSVTGGRPRARFTKHDVLSDYAAVTGFDVSKTDAKGDNPTDNGTDMGDAAKYRQKTGVLAADTKRHKIDAYVALEVGNWDQLVVATWLMGAAGVGLQLPQSAMTQFDANKPWTAPWPWQKPKIAGGHYVCSVGRDGNGNMPVVTWGRPHPMTKGFYERFSDEALVYLSLEVLDEKNLSPEGFDADTLRKQLRSLS